MIVATPKLLLLSRLQCHLCEQMVLELVALQADHTFEFEVVEIDDDPALMQRYGHRVPVLVAHDQEICSAKLDREALEAFLARR